MLEFFAGMFSYFIVFLSSGWYPTKIMGKVKEWDLKNIDDLEDSYGQEWVR